MNAGVSFGLLPGISPWVIGIVLVLLGVVLGREKSRWGRVGIGLVMLGGTANLLQRIFYGGVVDPYLFLGLLYNNLADYIIFAGLLVYGYSYFVRRRADSNH